MRSVRGLDDHAARRALVVTTHTSAWHRAVLRRSGPVPARTSSRFWQRTRRGRPSKTRMTRTGESSLSRTAMSACAISCGTFHENCTRPRSAGSMRTCAAACWPMTRRGQPWRGARPCGCRQIASPACRETCGAATSLRAWTRRGKGPGAGCQAGVVRRHAEQATSQVNVRTAAQEEFGSVVHLVLRSRQFTEELHTTEVVRSAKVEDVDLVGRADVVLVANVAAAVSSCDVQRTHQRSL